MAENEKETLPAVPDESVPERPHVVDEAHEALAAYTRELVGAGGVAILAWVVSLFFGLNIPALWLLPILAVLAVLFIAPVTREPRLSREVLRRWDQLRVDRALEASGISSDPRLEVAESMAERVLRHPSVDERTREATNTLVLRLRRLLSDLGRVEYLTHARLTMREGDASRSISDLQDLLDARIAEILGQLAGLHRTVVLRDTASMESVVRGVEDLLRELEAESEVERLLSDAERS